MSENDTEFIPPASLEEADIRRRDLARDVQSIQAQLGDRQRTDDNGRRLSSQEYWRWKRRATHSLNMKLDELRFIKQWIQKQRATSHPATEYLRDVMQIIRDLREDDVDFDSSELSVIESAQRFLDRQ